MRQQRTYFPAALILLVLAAQMGAIQLAARGRGVRLQYVKPYFFGLDYHDFHQASQRILDGQSPYAVSRYVTPPIAAYLNLPLALLPFHRAVVVVAVAIPIVVLLSGALVAGSFLGLRGREGAAVLALTAGVVALSYPIYFLFERGNIDGFVLLLMCLTALRAAGSRCGAVGGVSGGGRVCREFAARRAGVLAGLCLGLAVGAKIYPILLVVPLVVQRRWRTLATAGVCLLVFAVAIPFSFWHDFAARIALRAGRFSIDENGSLPCTFFYLGYGLSKWVGVPFRQGVWTGAGYGVAALLLGLCAWADHVKQGRRDAAARRAAALLYLPFMAAVPARAYHYQLVVLLPLIPLLCYLWRERTGRRVRRVLLLLALGIALSQWQAVALERLCGTVVSHVIPGIGLFLVLLACTWLKLRYALSKGGGNEARAQSS